MSGSCRRTRRRRTAVARSSWRRRLCREPLPPPRRRARPQAPPRTSAGTASADSGEASTNSSRPFELPATLRPPTTSAGTAPNAPTPPGPLPVDRTSTTPPSAPVSTPAAPTTSSGGTTTSTPSPPPTRRVISGADADADHGALTTDTRHVSGPLADRDRGHDANRALHHDDDNDHTGNHDGDRDGDRAVGRDDQDLRSASAVARVRRGFPGGTERTAGFPHGQSGNPDVVGPSDAGGAERRRRPSRTRRAHDEGLASCPCRCPNERAWMITSRNSRTGNARTWRRSER